MKTTIFIGVVILLVGIFFLAGYYMGQRPHTKEGHIVKSIPAMYIDTGQNNTYNINDFFKRTGIEPKPGVMYSINGNTFMVGYPPANLIQTGSTHVFYAYDADRYHD